MHAFELLQLPQSFFFRRLRHLGGFNLFAELLNFFGQLVPLPKLTKSLKGIPAKRSNEMLGFTGNSLWQEESYDRLVRDQREFEKIRCERAW